MANGADMQIDKVYELIQAANYVAASSLIAELKMKGITSPDLTMFEAVCEYEDSRDVNCLRILAEFVAENGSHPKIHYAVFTAAMCLDNLGLTEQALNLLETLPANYPDLERELSSLISKATDREEAIKSANTISYRLRS